MLSFALLVLRLAFGALMTGHGAQKLFGWFNGPGIKGTTGWLESMGMRPGKPWALLAGASEFGGGVLTMLGFLNPLGPLGTIGAMGMASAKVHAGKPIWVTSGGAELPVLNIAAALALGIAGPGKLSVDCKLGLHLPRRLILVPGLALAAGSVAYGVMSSNKVLEREQAQQTAQPLTQAESEQMLEVEERPEAVLVPGSLAAAELEQRSDLAAQEPERVSGAHLQAGEDAAHPI